MASLAPVEALLMIALIWQVMELVKLQLNSGMALSRKAILIKEFQGTLAGQTIFQILLIYYWLRRINVNWDWWWRRRKTYSRRVRNNEHYYYFGYCSKILKPIKNFQEKRCSLLVLYVEAVLFVYSTNNKLD
jgi:hypothetical protein